MSMPSDQDDLVEKYRRLPYTRDDVTKEELVAVGKALRSDRPGWHFDPQAVRDRYAAGELAESELEERLEFALTHEQPSNTTDEHFLTDIGFWDVFVWLMVFGVYLLMGMVAHLHWGLL